MKKILFGTTILLFCISANVENYLYLDRNWICDKNTRTCEDIIYLFEGSKVIWSLTSQTSSTPGFKVEFLDATGQWVTLVDTAVFSKNLENVSTGDFRVPLEAQYRLVMTDVLGVRTDETGVHGSNQTAVMTHVFAIEDGEDDDYNDAFGFFSWIAKVD